MMHQVQAPDGSVHAIEAPEGATPEQVVSFFQQSYDPSVSLTLGQGQPAPPDLAQKIGTAFDARKQEFANINKRANNGQYMPDTMFQTATNTIGYPVDAAMNTLGTIANHLTPQFLEDAGTNIGQSNVGSAAKQLIGSAANAVSDKYHQMTDGTSAGADLKGLATLVQGSALGELASPLMIKSGEVLSNAGQGMIDKRITSAAQDAVTPKLTVKQAINQGAGKRIEQGFFGSKVAPLPQQQAAAEVLSSLPGFSPGNTAVKNYQLADNALSQEAESLRSTLDASGIKIAPEDYQKGLNDIKTQIQNTQGISDATRAARIAPIDTMLQITNGASTLSELLAARQELDRTFFNDKGVLPASAKKVYKDAIAPVRDYTNQFIDQSVPDTAVTDSLAKQSALFTATDALASKAIKEAPTAFGRAAQNLSDKIPIKDPRLKMAAEAAGVAGMGAATYFAPAAAGAAGAVYLGSKALPYALKGAGSVLEKGGQMLGGNSAMQEALQKAFLARKLNAK